MVPTVSLRVGEDEGGRNEDELLGDVGRGKKRLQIEEGEEEVVDVDGND